MTTPVTLRDASMVVQGYLKSIIESGAPPEKWEELLKAALPLHVRYTKRYHENMNLIKKDTKNG